MKKIEQIVLVLFLFLLSFVPFLWLSKGQLILGYDAVFPLNPTAFLLDRVYSWTSTQGFAMDQSGIQGSMIIHFIDSIPYFFGFSATNAEKIVCSFWFFAILFSAFIFIVRIERSGFIQSKYLRYFFPVLYTFNFYLLQGWWAIERTKFSLVVALPLILSIILPLIKSNMSVGKILKGSVLCSIVLTIFNGGGWVGLPLYGGLLVMLGCFYLFFNFLFLLNRKIREFWMLNLFFVFFALWYLVLNAYTLLPFILTTIKDYGKMVASAGGAVSLIEWSKYISTDASFINLFRLQGIPDWYNSGRLHPYASVYLNSLLFIFFSFLIPLMLFLLFFKKEHRRELIIPFFLLALIVSQFFTAGVRPPLGFIFEFLMKGIPGFVVFRSAIFKFGYAYWFTLSFFVGLFLSDALIFFTSRMKKRALGTIAGMVGSTIIIILILLYHFPFLTGNIFNIESTSVSSRVSVPSYISEFAQWWQENGKTDKILLLPKLNDYWLFEQYRWNYMSYFPITGNYASRNIIENAVILSEKEQNAVSDLYGAINSNNFEKIDYLTSVLGVRYFLVRRDFYYDYPNQKTDDPIFVEEQLIKNPKISLVKEFGNWVVYKYSDPKSLFVAKNRAVFISGDVANDQLYLSEQKEQLALTKESFDKFFDTFSSVIIHPSCLNCQIEKEDMSISFPRPRILLDSNLYKFVELRDRLKIKKNETVEEKVNRLIGNTLRMIGQIDQLIEQDRNEYYVNLAKDKLVKMIQEVSDSIPIIFNNSSNPYRYITSLQQYLVQEDKFLNELITSRVDRKEVLIILEKALYAIDNLNDRLNQIYNANDSDNKKIYKFIVDEQGNYKIQITKNSLGTLENNDFGSIYLSIDNKTAEKGILSGSVIDFGEFFLEKGAHIFNLSIPSQKNLFSVSKVEKLAGKNCHSFLIDNFSYSKVYKLTFKSKNNFDPGFFYFIDHGNSFSPMGVNYIPLAGEQIKNQKIIVSSARMQLDKTAKKLRTSFCALSLTEDLFEENVRDLSMIELVSPDINLIHKISNQYGNAPEIEFKEIDQTFYKVKIKDAFSPFYLVFNQKYSSEWIADEGTHVLGNKLYNAWYIDKVGTYEINIEYEPQRYFRIGIVISTIAAFVAFFVILRRGKKDA